MVALNHVINAIHVLSKSHLILHQLHISFRRDLLVLFGNVNIVCFIILEVCDGSLLEADHVLSESLPMVTIKLLGQVLRIALDFFYFLLTKHIRNNKKNKFRCPLYILII